MSHTWLWHFTALLCVGWSERTRSHIKEEKKKTEQVTFLCNSQPASPCFCLLKTPSCQSRLNLPVRSLTPSQPVAMGRLGVFVDACTHIQLLSPVYSCLLVHTDTSSLTPMQMAFFLLQGGLQLKPLRCLMMPASSASYSKCSAAFFRIS